MALTAFLKSSAGLGGNPGLPLPSGRREPKGSEPQPRPRVDWHDTSMPGPLPIVSDSISAPARGRKVYSGGVMTSRLIPGRIELIYSPARTSARANPPFRVRFPVSEGPLRHLMPAWFKPRSQLRGGWGRRPQGDALRSEASALGARYLLPARPQPPCSCHPRRSWS